MPRTPEIPDFPASQLFLRRLAYSLVHDEARAEDLVQETWTAWIEQRPRGVTEPRAWLSRVLRNRAFNLKRGDARRAEREAVAGRPDPSEPETDGTLEAQAQLIEALRALDEPYRSTLVQRYYHDLAPKAIADKSGTALNTVKARLARGLERLRKGMDRRYGGDRRAWSHWLGTMGVPAVPVGVPESSAPGAGTGPLVGGSKLIWLGVLATVAAVSVSRGAFERPSSEPTGADEGDSHELSSEVVQRGEDAGRVPNARESVSPLGVERRAGRRSRGDTSLTEREDVLPASLAKEWRGSRKDSHAERLEWTQYAGNASHNRAASYPDGITAPKVLWFVPGCSGQPTLSKGSLYTGGLLPMRIDPATGELLGTGNYSLPKNFKRLWELEDRSDVAGKAFNAFLLQAVGVATLSAPAIAKDRVLFRTEDGFVTAYDRTLEDVQWKWEEPFPQPATAPGCLVNDELYVFTFGTEVIALDIEEGVVKWRFRAGETMDMTPASGGGSVFFGGAEPDSSFYALDVETGAYLWETRRLSEGIAHAAVLDGKVLAVTWGTDKPLPDGESSESSTSGVAGRIVMLNGETGRRVWSASFEGAVPSVPGFYREQVVLGFKRSVAGFRLSDGKRVGSHIRAGWNPLGSPNVIGSTLYFGCDTGFLYAYDWAGAERLWSFRAPVGAPVKDFVHSGERIYVSTSVGLFCIGNGRRKRPRVPGIEEKGVVVQWDKTLTSFFDLLLEAGER